MIDKKEFYKQNFSSRGIIVKNNDSKAGRVPVGWKPENDDKKLRLLIRDIMLKETDKYRNKTNKSFGDYTIIEEACRIPTDTMKKALSGRYKITRNFLAKFTVGLKLGIDISNSLFKIHSGELNLTNDFDYITYFALKTKDDIDDFIEEIDKFLGINLDRTR